jgi:hypothetical protein
LKKDNYFIDVFPVYESDVDKAYRTGHAISSLLPIGSAIFESIITHPTQKRTKLWMEQVIKKLVQLEEDKQINFNELAERPEFSAVFLRIIQEVEISSQKEKQAHLANFVINTALEHDVDEDLLFILTDSLKTITPSHIQALKLYADPAFFDERFIEIHNYTRMGHTGGFTHFNTDSAPKELAKIFYKDKSANITANNIDLSEEELYWQLIHKHISLLNLVELKEQMHKTIIPACDTFHEKNFTIVLNCSTTSLGAKLLKLISP